MHREPESLVTVLCLKSESKQDQGPNSTEPVVAKRNFVTSSEQGSKRKRALKYCSTKSNIQVWASLNCCSCFSSYVWFCPDWARYKTAMISVEVVHKHTPYSNLCGDWHSCGAACAPRDNVDLLVQIRTDLEPLIFFHTRIRLSGCRIS